MVARVGFYPRRLLSQGGSVMALFQIINFLIFGGIGKFGMPIFAINNLIGRIADKFLPNSLFSLNFTILAERP
jgi:hypothetical protein